MRLNLVQSKAKMSTNFETLAFRTGVNSTGSPCLKLLQAQLWLLMCYSGSIVHQCDPVTGTCVVLKNGLRARQSLVMFVHPNKDTMVAGIGGISKYPQYVPRIIWQTVHLHVKSPTFRSYHMLYLQFLLRNTVRSCALYATPRCVLYHS